MGVKDCAPLYPVGMDDSWKSLRGGWGTWPIQ